MTKKEFEKYKFSINTVVQLENSAVLHGEYTKWHKIVFIDFEDNGVGILDQEINVLRFISYKQIKYIFDGKTYDKNN